MQSCHCGLWLQAHSSSYDWNFSADWIWAFFFFFFLLAAGTDESGSSCLPANFNFCSGAENQVLFPLPSCQFSVFLLALYAACTFPRGSSCSALICFLVLNCCFWRPGICLHWSGAFWVWLALPLSFPNPFHMSAVDVHVINFHKETAGLHCLFPGFL